MSETTKKAFALELLAHYQVEEALAAAEAAPTDVAAQKAYCSTLYRLHGGLQYLAGVKP